MYIPEDLRFISLNILYSEIVAPTGIQSSLTFKTRRFNWEKTSEIDNQESS